MAISWQTGEPPCGVALVIEYKFRGWPQAYKRIGMKLPSGNWRLDCHSGEQSDVEVLCWSTLDDDRAAMAMGALEKMVREQGASVSFSVDFAVNEWTIYDENGNDLVEAPTIIGAIEKLTEAGNGPESD